MGSDEEDLETGSFLDYIKKVTEKATKERLFLIKELKAKERRGCIFFDRIKRVVAAVQREKGKYDYLIEWAYCKEDKLTPTTTLVKGSHFAFANPLRFRRFVEEQYLETNNNNKANEVMMYSK